MTTETVNFQANAGIKDIVGRGLIHDDNIAIIELVKNAKDAFSKKVIIEFLNESIEGQKSGITIKDYGQGMTRDDIINKWLNIAFSEKSGDIKFAGSKGVGRFSCDRLGKNLILYTKSEEDKYLKLPIDWQDFEGKGMHDEIASIPLTCHIMSEKEFLEETGEHAFKSGTILKIMNLRSSWNDKKMKKLIRELEKFSPSLDKGFEVYLYSSSKFADEEVKDKINKKINNSILEKLAFKTTYIISSIDAKGEMIETSLFYQGNQVYTYKAKNPYDKLKNIIMEIHYLDMLSKVYFTRRVGTKPNDFGSIFLFYNDFRISPYGNFQNDWLGLDQRKSQGTARNLGTREVFGRIDITDNDQTFSTISSREGLAHNQAYSQLVAYDQEEKAILNTGKESYGYVTTIIRQLENFVVSGLEWNRLIDRLSVGHQRVINAADIIQSPNRYRLKTISPDKVKEACNRILKSDFEVVDFEINDQLILDIQKVTEEKYSQYVSDFMDRTKSKAFVDLSASEKGTVAKIIKTEQTKTAQARQERNYAEKQRDQAEKRAEIEEGRASHFEGLVPAEAVLKVLIAHIIKQISGGIEKDVKSILHEYYQDHDSVKKEDLVQVLEDVIIDIATIKESSSMATKANFEIDLAEIPGDLYEFLDDYIKEIVSKEKKWGLSIKFLNPNKVKHVCSFGPAGICVLLTNLFSNAINAGAENLWIRAEKGEIIIEDDGEGFDFEQFSEEDFFKKGFTTTEGGTGFGMFHCKEIAKKHKARIMIGNRKQGRGASVRLSFNNED